jgi:hypothetical protein
MNVTIDDIKGIEQELDVELTKEQRDTILKQYQRVVMDNADNWNVILKDLINGMNVDNRKHTKYRR